MSVSPLLEQPAKKKSIYYGWIIVTVGFLAHIASAFSISSTLSVFLKPLSADLGISPDPVFYSKREARCGTGAP